MGGEAKKGIKTDPEANKLFEEIEENDLPIDAPLLNDLYHEPC